MASERRRGWLVELYVYDLSHGMASAMSMSIIGKQIDGIYHTGIVVYGTEYFFGGGIQSARPGTTMAGQPQQIIPVGFTEIPQMCFHDFLNDNAARFSPDKYNLLTHNCNNFTDESCEFLTGSGIPKFIVDLPQDALNTPMGQAFRPMIDNMQNQMRQGGIIPGLGPGQNAVRPNLPITNSIYNVEAPVVSQNDLTKVATADQQEIERNRIRAQAAANNNNTTQNNQQQQQPANPFAAFMNTMNQNNNNTGQNNFNMNNNSDMRFGQQNQQPFSSFTQPPAPSQQPTQSQNNNTTTSTTAESTSRFKVFTVKPEPKIMLTSNVDASVQKLCKQIKQTEVQALLNEISTICKNTNNANNTTSSSKLTNKHYTFITTLILKLQPKKLLSLLSVFSFMCVRPEAGVFFSTRLELLHKILNHVGLGTEKSAPNHILVLTFCCISHIYSNQCQLDEEILSLALGAISTYSNTVSLAAIRLLFNMCLLMEFEMGDIQCQITTSICALLPEIKHVGTRRRGLWILSYLFFHIEECKDLALALEFEIDDDLRNLEGNTQKDQELLDDLHGILTESSI